MLISAFLGLALFEPVAAAQEVKQIKLTEKHIQGFMAAYEDMAKLYDGADPDKPDPKVEAQAAAIAKNNGFASLAEYDEATTNISMIMAGIEQRRILAEGRLVVLRPEMNLARQINRLAAVSTTAVANIATQENNRRSFNIPVIQPPPPRLTRPHSMV